MRCREHSELSRLIASFDPRQPKALARRFFLNSHFRLAAITSILVEHKNTKQGQENLASYHRLALCVQKVPSNPSGLDFRSTGSHHVGSWYYSNRCPNCLISLSWRVGSVQSQYPVQRVFADPRCHHRHVRDRACRRPGQVTSQALGLSLSIPKFAMNDPVIVCAQAH